MTALAAGSGRRTPRTAMARRARRRETGLALLFLLPSMLVFGVFAFYPFVRTFQLGQYRSNYLGTKFRYVGWRQFTEVLGGSNFREGVLHSATYVLYSVPAGLVLGTLLAVAANRRLKGIKAFQAIFSSTIATSVAVASLIFYVLLNRQVGVFRVGWLDDPKLALFGVSLSSIWQNLGLSFVIVLAGLQAVPEELLEVAKLDGYGPVRRFFKVTLPLLSPVLMFLLVVLVVFGFQAFAQIEILTRGGPAGATETVVFKIFQARNARLGEAAVMSVGLFGLTFVITLAQFLILDRRVHYGR